MERVLKKFHESVSDFIRSLPDLYLFLTPDLRIIDATAAYMNATLTTRENIIGRYIFDVFPDNPMIREHSPTKNLHLSLQRVISEKKPNEMELQHYDIPNPKGGFEEKYWHPINIPVLNYDGEVKYIIHKVIDVTHEVMLEKESINKEEQTKKLTRINSDLSIFTYAASHDLKGPISNIEGLIKVLKENLEDGCDREELSQLVGMMTDSVLRFKDRISQLSELTKEEPSKQDCYNIIQDVIKDIANMIKASKATINIEIKECPEIMFPQKNLKSIVHNLLTNAIKYRSPERDPKIDIKTKVLKNFIVLYVQDNGLGIDLKKHKDIFSKFKRAHNHVEGTGIGLHIVKTIVENNGGKIEVKSSVGEGTTFKIYFKK